MLLKNKYRYFAEVQLNFSVNYNALKIENTVNKMKDLSINYEQNFTLLYKLLCKKNKTGFVTAANQINLF